jgi:hypothetical protein
MSPPDSVAGCIWRATFKEFLVENFKKFGLPNEDTARKCWNEIDIYETVKLWSLSMDDLRHTDLSMKTKKEFMRMIRTIQHDETFQALAQKRYGDYYKPPKGMKTEMPDDRVEHSRHSPEMPDDRVEHSRHSRTIVVAGCQWYGELGDFFVNNYVKFGFSNKHQAESFCKDLFLHFDFFDYGTETLAEFKYEHLVFKGFTNRQREKFMLTLHDVKNDPTFKALVKARFHAHSHAHSDGKLEVLLGKLRALSVHGFSDAKRWL